MAEIFSILLNERVTESFYVALRSDLERIAKLVDASPSGLRMSVWSEMFRLLDFHGSFTCEGLFTPIVQRWAYCSYDFLAAELLFLAFRRCDAEKRAEVYIKLLHPVRQHMLQVELATPSRLPPSPTQPEQAVALAPAKMHLITPIFRPPPPPAPPQKQSIQRHVRPPPGTLPTALPKPQLVPFLPSAPATQRPLLAEPAPALVQAEPPARREKRLLGWEDKSIQLAAATMTRRLSPPRKRVTLMSPPAPPPYLQPVPLLKRAPVSPVAAQPLQPAPNPPSLPQPVVHPAVAAQQAQAQQQDGQARSSWHEAVELSERGRLQRQNADLQLQIAQLQRAIPPHIRRPAMPPDLATNDLALLRRRNAELQSICGLLQTEFHKEHLAHQKHLAQIQGAAPGASTGVLQGPPSDALQPVAQSSPPAAPAPPPLPPQSQLQQSNSGRPAATATPKAPPAPSFKPTLELPVLTTTEMRRLLGIWAPLLDGMSLRHRELIWCLCRTIPNFTTRKYSSLTEALSEWSQPNCPQALQSSVGVLFSAVALLQISGDLSVKLLLPDTNVLAFQEGKERLRFRSYFASLVSSRMRRINFIESLKDEMDACAKTAAEQAAAERSIDNSEQ